MRRRIPLLALLALAVPLPALALSGAEPDEGAPAVTSIAVSSSLDSCGTAAATIVCKIDASWNPVPGATRYTASVTRADGSVVDYGEVGAGSGSFWVPYVGNGTYTVSVSAYGTPPGSDRGKLVARGSSEPRPRAGGAPREAHAPGQRAREGVAASRPGQPGQAPPDEPEEPSCDEPAEPEPEEPAADEPAPGDADPAAASRIEPLSAEAKDELSESAELPESVDCPEAQPTP